MLSRLALAVLALSFSLAAAAQVKIGLMVSATGPTTAIGTPQKNTGDLLPRKIGDVTIEYIQYDDGGDTTRAVQNAKKLIQEHNIDALIGPSTTPNALAILDIIAEAKVPLMATVGTSSVVEPLDAKKRWVFKTTQNDDLISAALVKHMVKTGVKTVGFIGFKDPYGENWHKVFSGQAEKAGIRHGRDRVLPAQRSQRHGAGAEAHRRQAGRGPDRRRRRPRRAPADHAARPGLQRADLPDARRRDRRFHPPRQGKGRRHRCSPRGRCW